MNPPHSFAPQPGKAPKICCGAAQPFCREGFLRPAACPGRCPGQFPAIRLHAVPRLSGKSGKKPNRVPGPPKHPRNPHLPHRPIPALSKCTACRTQEPGVPFPSKHRFAIPVSKAPAGSGKSCFRKQKSNIFSTAEPPRHAFSAPERTAAPRPVRHTPQPIMHIIPRRTPLVNRNSQQPGQEAAARRKFTFPALDEHPRPAI